MIFGDVSIHDARGCILAHTVRLPGGALKKGTVLGVAEIGRLSDNRIDTVMAARLEPGDVLENDAAARIADVICGANVAKTEAFTGRVNLAAERDGIFIAENAKITELNRVHEAMTVATLPPHTRVDAGQLVATIKIIPFCVAEDQLHALEAAARSDELSVAVAPFRAKRVALVLTRIAGDTEKVVAKRQQAIDTRVTSLGGELIDVRQCDHDIQAVTRDMQKARAQDPDILLVFGASAIVDRADVIPAALVRSGGDVVHLGMPVDPGNLLLFGNHGEVPVVGVPSCAASIKENGFDWVLQRLFADLPVDRDAIVAMAAGGLLTEIPSRPRPRERS